MKINVADIINVQGTFKKFSIVGQDLDMLETLSPIRFSKPIQLDGNLEVDGEHIHLLGILTTEVKVPCDRCLSDVIHHIESEVADSFGQTHSKDEEGRPIINSTIDLGPTIIETILFSLPMKMLCSEHCKGLCTVCGQNLNEKSCDCDLDYVDPRLEKFKLLFQDSTRDESNKEV